jgi:hypothetical protein
MRLPPDWEAKSSGGYFPHLVSLTHTTCGFNTGRVLVFDLHSDNPGWGKPAVHRLLANHQCEPDD